MAVSPAMSLDLERLESSLPFLAAIVESSDDAIVGKDLQGTIVSWNRAAAQIYGYTADEVIGRSATILISPDRPDEERRILERIQRGERVEHYETVRIRKDGSPVNVSLTFSPVVNGHGEVVGASAIARDITQKKMAERAGAFLAAIVESSDDAIVGKDLDGRIVSWNRGAERIYGYPASEAIGRPAFILLSPDRPDEETEILQRIRKGEVVTHYETQRIRKNGTPIYISLTVSPVRDGSGKVIGASAISRDITENKKVEEQVKASLREKEMLLKEIHHRVKNNMQVISSLLQLQTNYIKDPQLLATFQESQNRIRSMALIHEKLYQSHQLSKVDFGDYVQNLCSILLRSYSTSAAQVQLKVECEPMSLNIDTAIPVGLILNELVSNSLKYAFAGNRTGHINIHMQSLQHGEYVLKVMDNGAGFPEHFSAENSPSLGLRLVKILTEQIGGTSRFHSNGGVEFQLNFSEVREKENIG